MERARPRAELGQRDGSGGVSRACDAPSASAARRWLAGGRPSQSGATAAGSSHSAQSCRPCVGGARAQPSMRVSTRASARCRALRARACPARSSAASRSTPAARASHDAMAAAGGSVPPPAERPPPLAATVSPALSGRPTAVGATLGSCDCARDVAATAPIADGSEFRSEAPPPDADFAACGGDAPGLVGLTAEPVAGGRTTGSSASVDMCRMRTARGDGWVARARPRVGPNSSKMTETAAIRTLAKMSQANILRRRGMLVRRAIASARPSAARAAPARAYQIASSQYAAAFDVPRPPVDREVCARRPSRVPRRVRRARVVRRARAHAAARRGRRAPRARRGGADRRRVRPRERPAAARGRAARRRAHRARDVVRARAGHRPARARARGRGRAARGRARGGAAHRQPGARLWQAGRRDRDRGGARGELRRARAQRRAARRRGRGRGRRARRPALVGCVSNFSNFLDLCRKALRNLELGVPVVRALALQHDAHTFRWTRLLQDALREAGGVDERMVAYASCGIAEQRRLMAACAGGSPPTSRARARSRAPSRSSCPRRLRRRAAPTP